MRKEKVFLKVKVVAVGGQIFFYSFKPLLSTVIFQGYNVGPLDPQTYGPDFLSYIFIVILNFTYKSLCSSSRQMRNMVYFVYMNGSIFLCYHRHEVVNMLSTNSWNLLKWNVLHPSQRT